MIEQVNTKDDTTLSMSPLRRELSDRVFGELNGVMNEIHAMEYSDRFWRILLEDHVKTVISRIRVLNRGVLHKTLESLMDHLNTIDMDTWWQSVVNSPEYMDFKQQFARPVNEESEMVE